MRKAQSAIAAGTVSVIDPETGATVELEVVKDPVSGGMFAVDASFLDQVADSVNSPFNRHKLRLPEEPACVST